MTGQAAVEQGYAEVNGARFYYEAAGDGHPLVFLHAGIADRRMWDDQFVAFAERFRVIRYDMRGYGRTAMPAGDFSSSEDVFGLLRHLGVGPAHVVGLSKGGAVALDLTLGHPEAVASIVVANAVPSGFERSDVARRGWAEGEAAVERGEIARAIEIDLEMWVDGPNRRPDQVDAAVRERVREMTAPTYDVPDDLGHELPLEPRALHRLGEVRAPALIVVSDQDMPEMRPAAELMAAQIRNARMVAIGGAAHMVNMEQPAEFNRLVLEFLR